MSNLNRSNLRRFVLGLVTTAVAGMVLWAAPPDSVQDGEFHGQPAFVMANDKIELKVLPFGGAMVSLTLNDDPEKMNPMWDSFRADIEAGKPIRAGGSAGHFVCVDGFGPVSKEEGQAGLPGHGEAHTLPWVTQAAAKQGKVSSLTQAVQLPRVHEVLTRTIEMVDGENVVYVNSRLRNLLAFDRPICWAEHATIGSPFLERGVTVVDMSKNRAMTRPHEGQRPRSHRLPSGVEFEWPMAPLIAGGKADLRAAPKPSDSLDHTTHLMTGREHAFVTALHPEKRLLLGYVFKTSESPWLQTWEHFPPEGMMARGLEFGTQAFDLSRRTVITDNKLFGELLYRWLPARSEIKTSFLMFWTRTPDGFRGVSDVEVKGGKIRIQDAGSGQSITLAASRSL
ncbi:MAG: hypothetical protein O2968_11180 [Acidobacteria bacterium]|nr:hypothetical protein [Acidobacteriota bacterium]